MIAVVNHHKQPAILADSEDRGVTGGNTSIKLMLKQIPLKFCVFLMAVPLASGWFGIPKRTAFAAAYEHPGGLALHHSSTPLVLT